MNTNTECTCPSGNGSLRWPCPQHPYDELTELRKDAERWRAMRELLVAVDWNYGDPPMSIAAFELRTGVVMAGPKGADAIADAAVQARGIGAA